MRYFIIYFSLLVIYFCYLITQDDEFYLQDPEGKLTITHPVETGSAPNCNYCRQRPQIIQDNKQTNKTKNFKQQPTNSKQNKNKTNTNRHTHPRK